MNKDMKILDVVENLKLLLNDEYKEVNLDESQHALALEHDNLCAQHVVIYHAGKRLFSVLNSFSTIKDLAVCVVQMNNLYNSMCR